MARHLIGLMAIVALVAAPAAADVFIPGEFNGWDATTPMTETSAGSAIWTYDTPSYVDTELPTTFVLLSESGNWDSKFIWSGDSWAIMNPNENDTNTITFDLNTYADGWFPVTNRVGVAYEQGSWTAVGDWQGWDPSNAGTAMTPMGGGLYMHEATGLAPGDHWYKAVRTGTWDAIGGDSRSVNADNFGFTTDAVNDGARFYVDANNGILKVEVIPEPASMLGLALLGLLIRRR